MKAIRPTLARHVALTSKPLSQDARFERILLRSSLVIFTAVALGKLILSQPVTLTTVFLDADFFWLFVMGILLAIVRVLPASRHLLECSRRMAQHPRTILLLMAATSFVIAAVGASLAYHGYALSRDEDLARFDATHFRAGHLIASVPSQWRVFVPALEPRFILPVEGNAGWTSLYLPVHAALRAAAGLIADPALLNPLLVAVAVLAVAGVARQLWPSRPDAAIVAASLLAVSPQVLVTAMSPYAMTSHMAFDLLWLSLFLRGGSLSHVGAVVIGFLATGLHQLVFHPLFVAPFVFQLLVQRRWALATFYVVSYATIGIFWMNYWQMALDASGFGAPMLGSSYFERLRDLLEKFSVGGADFMAKNLLRFLAWENPLVWPLVGYAVFRMRELPLPLRSVAWGFGFTAAAMFVMLPEQGHGWGYRYFHGLIGGLCLLGAAGWVLITSPSPSRSEPKAATTLIVLAIATIFILLPGRTWEAAGIVAPYAAADAAIDAMRGDVVLVDTQNFPFGEDLVRNDPFLRNRPLRMDLHFLSTEQMVDLCGRSSVKVFGRAQGQVVGMPTYRESSAGTRSRVPIGCNP